MVINCMKILSILVYVFQYFINVVMSSNQTTKDPKFSNVYITKCFNVSMKENRSNDFYLHETQRNSYKNSLTMDELQFLNNISGTEIMKDLLDDYKKFLLSQNDKQTQYGMQGLSENSFLHYLSKRSGDYHYADETYPMWSKLDTGQYPDASEELFASSTELMILLTLAFLILTGGILKALTKRPQYVLIIMVLLGFMTSVLSEFVFKKSFPSNRNFLAAKDSSPFLIVIIFIPMNAFYRTMNVNIHEIRKCLGQIILVSVFGFVFQLTIMGYCIHNVDYLVKENYHWSAALLFGSFCAPIDSGVMLRLKTGHSRVLVPLLEGESILTMCLAVITFRLVIYYISVLSLQGSFADYAGTLFLTFCSQLILGAIVGIVLGLLVLVVFHYAKGDPVTEATVTTGCAFLIFCFAVRFLSLSGVIGVVTFAVVIQSRAIVRKATASLWMWLTYMINVILMFWVGLISGTLVSGNMFHWIFIGMIYVLTYLIRALTFLLLKPLLASMGYGLSWQEAIVATIGGIKQGTVALPLAVASRAIYQSDRHFFEDSLVAYIVGIYILSAIINGIVFGPLVRVLSIERVTLAKKGNMTRAVEYILNTRERALDTLKLDRTTADANWLIVTSCTQIQNPYIQAADLEEERIIERGRAGNDAMESFKDTALGAVYIGHTSFFNEALNEANIRVLKVKRVLCMKQFENGYISHDVLRALHKAIDSASDRRRAQTNLEDLRKYWRPKKYLLFLRRRVFKLFNLIRTTEYYKPNSSVRAFFYTIVMWRYYGLLIVLVLLINIMPDLYEVYWMSTYNLTKHETVLVINLFSSTFYVFDIVATIIGIGSKSYFTSTIFIFDLIVCIFSVMETIVQFVVYISRNGDKAFIDQEIYFGIICVVTILKIIRCIFYLYLVLNSFLGVTCSSFVDSMIDRQLLFGYEIGRAYLSVLEDVDKKLNRVVDDPEIIEAVRSREQNERYQLIQDLGEIQRDRPMLAITTKTRFAVLTVMKEMKLALDLLSEEGLLDVHEYELLASALDDCAYHLSKVGMVQPCPPQIILQGVSWLMGEETICNFLLNHAEVVSFNDEDDIIQRGDLPDGIYILVSGLVRAVYDPSVEALENWHGFGIVPNCDFFIHLDFSETQQDVVVAGNVIGEFGLFSDEPYDYTVTCFTSTQAYYISKDIMAKALEITPVFGYSLETRIWKTISIRIAMLVIPKVSHFHSWTKDRLKLHLQRGFVPFIDLFENIPINDLIEDIFLIQGVTWDAKSGIKFIAPCYIPLTIKLLLLNDPNEIRHDHRAPSALVKLFIIPTEGTQEWVLMNALASRTGPAKKAALPFRSITGAGIDENVIKSLRKKFRSRDSGSILTVESDDQRPSVSHKTGYRSTRQSESSVREVLSEPEPPKEVEEDEEIVVYVRKKTDDKPKENE